MFWERAEGAVPSRADEWFTPWRFAAVLAALTCLAYPDVIFGGRAFFHRDFAVFGYPLAYHHRESFWRGEIPLWNPLNICGLPFLAQWNTMALYPLSIFYLLLPLSWSLSMFCLIHFFLAGLGMYFLAQSWTENRFAAAVAGVAFPFNALMLNCLMWPNNIAALAWLPWLVWAGERAWREGGRWLLWAALVGSLQMLSGAPEVILLTWVLLAALLAGQMTLNSKERWRMARRFAFLVLWVAGLAAAQLLPFLDLLAHSQRGKSFADSLWSMPAWGWANYLVPLFRNYPTPHGVYAQPEQFWIASYYMGIAVTALALLGLAQARQPRVFLLIAITAFCLLMALGKHGVLYSALKRVVPGIGFMRYPVKFVLLPTFILPLLAGLGLARALGAQEIDWPRRRRHIIILGAVLLAAIGVLCWAAFQYPLAGASASVAAQSGASRAAFLAATLGGIISMRFIERPRLQTLARAGLLLLLWLDAMTAGPRPNPTVAPWVYEPNAVRKELRPEPVPSIGRSRAMLNVEAEGNLMYTRLTNSTDQVMYTRLALYGNCNLLDDIPKVAGMYSLFFRELGDVFSYLWMGTNPPAGLADFLSVSHINSPGKATQWDFRPNYLPWVTAGQQPLFADREQTLAALAAKNFDPRRVVFLPLQDRPFVRTTNSSRLTLTIRNFSAHKVELEVEAVEPSIVVISQSFYHNWRAYLDDKPTQLFRANHAFQAVEAPPGRHRLALVYQDYPFRGGALISLTSAAVWGMVFIRGRKRVLLGKERN